MADTLTPELLTVVGNAPYAVALDSGRHLHPGELAEVVDSARLRHQIEQRLILTVSVPEKTPRVPSAPVSEKEQ